MRHRSRWGCLRAVRPIRAIRNWTGPPLRSGATEIRRSFSDGGRFAERRRRYGFHLWYDIRFDEDVPVSCPGRHLVASRRSACPAHLSDSAAGQWARYSGEMVYRPAAIGAARPSGRAVRRPGAAAAVALQQRRFHQTCRRGADIDLFEAWKTTAGDPAVIVAIMDGGVRWTIPTWRPTCG